MDKSQIESYLFVQVPIPTDQVQKGTLPHRPDCILFDIYGTLFISASGDLDSAEEKNEEHPNLRKLLKEFGIGLSVKTLRSRLAEKIRQTHRSMSDGGIDRPEVEIDRIWMQLLNWNDRTKARAFAVRYELIVNPVWPMPGLSALITLLRSHQIPMGLVSNAQFFTPYLFRWFLDGTPEDVGFNRNLLFYSYRFGRAKPSPFLFQLAKKRLSAMNISPDRTLYVGNDMRNDILPAASLGFRTALFAGDGRSLRMRSEAPKATESAPDLVVTELSQLASILNTEPASTFKGPDDEQ